MRALQAVRSKLPPTAPCFWLGFDLYAFGLGADFGNGLDVAGGLWYAPFTQDL